MKLRLLVLFLLVFVCALAATSQTVLEHESTAIIRERTVDIALAVESRETLRDAKIDLMLIDPKGETRSAFTQQVQLSAGKKNYKFQMPFRGVAEDQRDEIVWWRVSYRVGDARGIVSVSELLPEDFDLRAASFQKIVPGETMRVRVRSLSPFTKQGVKGVVIKAELSLLLDTDDDEDELKIKANARTDNEGFALLYFKIPPGVKFDDDEVDIEITGQKNGVIRKISEDIDQDDVNAVAILTADKPLYQPGQTFNVRALLLDANNVVVPAAELEFRIEDEDDTVLLRQKVTTSAFGIASISWPIPDNARLGTYSVKVDTDMDLDEDRMRFKVSRYDLPNFSVSARSDKPFYLPSDTEANVTVSADYLFGKPVTRGKVRVVQETEREWNYREQKYEITEGQIVEGATAADGKFIARVDLRDDIAELKRNEWRRYEDISFAAYYTDLSTNRTEQRRFDIRLSKEPIHIYLVRPSIYHADLPLVAYVSTFYADGTPALCNVEIRDAKQSVSRFKTNSLGAARFEIDIPRQNIEGSEYKLRIVALDKAGRVGTFDESFELNKEDVLQIQSDKTIYKPGEVVELDVRSSQQSGYVYVDIAKDRVSLDSRVVELRDGKAHLRIPYRPSFKGDLAVIAYTDDEDNSWTDTMRAMRGIIFPEQQNLLINAKFSKDEYRPDEKGEVRFSVTDGSGMPAESAIGLGIFDKAIEERARTDSEFGADYFGGFWRLLGYQRSFGNIALKDLNDIDLTRAIEPETQLAAEIMLANNWYRPDVFHSSDRNAEVKPLYGDVVAKQVAPLTKVIEAQYAKDGDHPIDQQSLERIAKQNGLDLSQLRDAWGQPFVADFEIKRTQDAVTLSTSGPDEKPGTPDDFSLWSYDFNYFERTGGLIDRAVANYHERTGGYVRDAETLMSELTSSGFDSSRLKDRWGHDYKLAFEVSGRRYVIRILSLGPNGIFEPEDSRGDDFDVWKASTDYFGTTSEKINQILQEEVHRNKKPFPRSEKEFGEILRRGGLDIESVMDGYGRAVYVKGTAESRYADMTKIEQGKVTIVPVTEQLMSFQIRSRGPNPSAPSDDAELATFSAALTAAYSGTAYVQADVTTTVFSGAKGAIRGTITDPNGAVVPNAEVIATDSSDETRKFITRSNDEGKFLLANLASGRYWIRVSAPGFSDYVYENIQVRSQTLTEINVELRLAAASAVVEVTAAADVDQTSSSIATNITTTRVTPFKTGIPEGQTSTPRLREYFPESLVWMPELLTDKRGKAELDFKMADNITTWKMFAIASNKRGKVGIVEKEVAAFQSFFVDLDPPKFLTEEDEIYLPTQVRNYTEQKQKVDVTMDKADWFTFLGESNKQRVDVATGASENTVFGFKAVTPIKSGKQRVTAIGQSGSDAIEKPVTVRPNGEEIVRTEAKVFNSSAKFDVSYPANALANTQKAELKIYPNLFSHVAESVEGMLKRPYGCGEQTISSTYPNLMILKFMKADSPLRQKAQRYLQKGYERLTGYQVADGGFTYWGGKDTSDVALTAYALRFLNDAKEFINVDETVTRRAEEWLISQQRADGSWTKSHRGESYEDASRTKLLSTYVTRSLAMRGAKTASTAAALAKALAYLQTRNAEIDEPYALALFGLASIDAGDLANAKQIASRLEKMAIPEGSKVYWKLETNTPFYGWGTAGRIETTALVMQLLTRVAKLESRPGGDLEAKGLMFLLGNKDRYGVWYSTQTTVNVLDAFLAILSTDAAPQPQVIQVAVNGARLPDVSVAADRIEPIYLDLTGKVSASSNTIEVHTSTNAPVMSQTVSTHYIDWRDSESSNTTVGRSRALRLDYKCDRTEAAVLEDVSCTVETERIGSKGYGMLLAEIGTPPGADVSRESLEAALQSDWSLSRYDVLPDRIVFYMWSRAGGTKFNFKFRPRYGINAQTPASIVYDYYNPEAHATVVPLKFRVR